MTIKLRLVPRPTILARVIPRLSGIEAVIDDINVTGEIGLNGLTLGWTGLLAESRGGTGISNLGEGVPEALAIDVGDSGAFVIGNISSANNIIHVSASGDDSNDGRSWFTPKLTIQAGINAASGGGVVYVANGTFTLSAAISMLPNVKVIGSGIGTIITQPPAADLNPLVEFYTNTADGAGLENLTIDADRDTNTEQHITVSTLDADDVVIRNCTLKNSPYIAVYHRDGLRPVFENNIIDNVRAHGIYLTPTVVGTANAAKISQNRFSGVGLSCIIPIGSNYNEIIGNRIDAPLHTGLVCTMTNSGGLGVATATTGTFTGITVGMIFISDDGGGGQNEAIVTSIDSSTVIHLDRSITTGVGLAAAWGGGDCISVDSSSFTRVLNNQISGGVTYQIAVVNLSADQSAQRNTIIGNLLTGAGGPPIGVYDDNTTGGHNPAIFDLLIANNAISDAFLKGCGDTGFAAAIHIMNTGDENTGSDAGAKIILVANNHIHANTASMLYGIQSHNILLGYLTLVGNQITSATTAAVDGAAAIRNALNDFQQGTWTPVLNSFTVVGGTTLTGTYTRIGRLVHASFAILAATSIASTAQVSNITGLPYTPTNASNGTVSDNSTVLGVGIGHLGADGKFWTPTWAASGSAFIGSFDFIV